MLTKGASFLGVFFCHISSLPLHFHNSNVMARAEMAAQFKAHFEKLPTAETLEALSAAYAAEHLADVNAALGKPLHAATKQSVWFAQFRESIAAKPGNSQMAAWARGAPNWRSVTVFRTAISRAMEALGPSSENVEQHADECVAMLDTIDSALDHALAGVDRFALYAAHK